MEEKDAEPVEYPPYSGDETGSAWKPFRFEKGGPYGNSMLTGVWEMSKREQAECFLKYEGIYFSIDPNGRLRYADEDEIDKDEAHVRLNELTEAFVAERQRLED